MLNECCAFFLFPFLFKQGSLAFSSCCLDSQLSLSSCLCCPSFSARLACHPFLPQASLPPSSSDPSFRCLSWWGSPTMNSNPRCTEEHIEAQRGGELLPKSHSKSLANTGSVLHSRLPALRSPCFLKYTASPPEKGPRWWVLGAVPGTGLHVATGEQGDSDMPSTAQSLSFSTCPEDILPPSPLRLEPMDPEGALHPRPHPT